MSSTPDELMTVLLSRRAEFIGFLAKRLGGNHADAEDLLQHSFAKAVSAAQNLRETDRIVPWFYQVLRNAIIDHVRASQSLKTRECLWTTDTHSIADMDRYLCSCLEPIIDTLPAQQAALIRRTEIGTELVSTVAASVGLTPNAASVALHRARASLRQKLIAFCGDCASGACLHCDCDTDLPNSS